MSVKIVPMTADHLEELEKLERICFSRPWSRKMLAEELENQCAAFLVAEDSVSGRVLGYAGLMVVADEGYITNVAVFPEYRRQGIAAQILQVFLQFAAANHLAFLTLEVRPSNAAAIALYQGVGFEEVGRRKNYYDLPKEDALILTKYFETGEAQQQCTFWLLNPPAMRRRSPSCATDGRCSRTRFCRRRTCTHSMAASCRRSPRASMWRPSPV